MSITNGARWPGESGTLTLTSLAYFLMANANRSDVMCDRWVKFEEDVEEGGERWSKPHVASLSLHSLFEVRKSIVAGLIKLDMDASSMREISGQFACPFCCSVILQQCYSKRMVI